MKSGMEFAWMSALSGLSAHHAASVSQAKAPERGVAKKVVGVLPGVFSVHGNTINACALTRELPGKRDTREGGFRDALEAMAMALLAEGVALQVVNAATQVVLDGYSNDQ